MKKYLMWGGIILVVVFVWWWMGLAPSNQKGSSETKTTGTTQAPTAKTGASIEIKGSKFNPASLTVKAGETVSVTNMDIVGHSLTADGASFDTGVLSRGKSGTFMAPDKPGTYKFHCTVHPSMKGTLIVE